MYLSDEDWGQTMGALKPSAFGLSLAVISAIVMLLHFCITDYYNL